MINTTQLVVKTDRTTIEWLEHRGYKNSDNLPNSYIFPVFTVDLQTKRIFVTNTTCMAAACSQLNKPIVYDLNKLQEMVIL